MVHFFGIAVLAFGTLVAATAGTNPAAAQAAESGQAPAGVTLEIQTPPFLRRADGGADSRLLIKAILTNTTDQPVTLTVPTSCDVYRWLVADLRGNIVQPDDYRGCDREVQHRVLQPGQVLTHKQSLMVRGSRLQENRVYQVVYSFWGVQGAARFTARGED